MPEIIDTIAIKVKLDDTLVNRQLEKIRKLASSIIVTPKFNASSINAGINNIQNRLNNLLINPQLNNIGKQIATNITSSGSLIGNALGEVIGAGLTSSAVSNAILPAINSIDRLPKDNTSAKKVDWFKSNLLKEGEDPTERLFADSISTRKKIQYKLNNKPLILPIKTKIESFPKLPKIPKIAQSNMPKEGISGGLGVLKGLKGLGGGLISYAVISKGIREISDATKEAVESAEGLAKLDSVLKSTGNTTGFTSSQLNDMANNVSKVTNFTDENITSAQTLLATFSNIKEDIFNGAIKGATDLSSIFGVDLDTSVKQIGKLLNDPLANINALKKAGISFSDEQKKQIELLINQNKLYDAQKIILGEINSKVGGSAEKASNSFTQVKNLMGEVRERIGQVVVDTMTLGTGFSGIKGWLDKIITKFDEFRKTEQYISIISKLRFSFQYLFIVAELGFKNIITLIKPIVEAFGVLVNVVVSAIGVFGKIGKALGLDGVSDKVKKMNEELGNLPVITSALKIPGELISNHKEAFDKLKNIRDEYTKNMSEGKLKPLIQSIKTESSISSIENKSEDKVTKTLDKAKSKAKELKTAISSAFNIGDISNWWDTFLQSTQDMANKLEESMNFDRELVPVMANVGNENKDYFNRIGGMQDLFSKDIFNTGNFKNMFDGFDGSFKSVDEANNTSDIIEEGNDTQEKLMEKNNELLGQVAKNVGVFG